MSPGCDRWRRDALEGGGDTAKPEKIMNDPIQSDTSIDSFAALPMQPTGSGVADLEIAYEQMRLDEDAAAGDIAPGEAEVTSSEPALRP